MAVSTGFRLSNGVEVGSTFAARVSTARAAVGMRNSAGTDLASLLEPLHGSTAKVGATGFRMSNGQDINLAFDTVAGVPQNFSASPYDHDTGDTAIATLSINSDGTVGSTGDTGIKWFSNQIAGIGAGYQVKFTKTSGSIGWSGTFDTWLALSTSRSIAMQCATPAGKPGAAATGTASITIRDASTLATVCTGTATFDVASSSGGMV